MNLAVVNSYGIDQNQPFRIQDQRCSRGTHVGHM